MTSKRLMTIFLFFMISSVHGLLDSDKEWIAALKASVRDFPTSKVHLQNESSLLSETSSRKLIEVYTTAVDLGTASAYAVLASSMDYKGSNNIIHGNTAFSEEPLFDGSSGTASESLDFDGTMVIATDSYTTAKNDLNTAIVAISGRSANYNWDSFSPSVTNTYYPGVYKTGTSFFFTVGTPLILDGQGDPDAVFIFYAGLSMSFYGSNTISVINGATIENVFWVASNIINIGGSCTIVGYLIATNQILYNGTSTTSGPSLAVNYVNLGKGASNTVINGYPLTTIAPSEAPSEAPTLAPSVVPSAAPSVVPSAAPSVVPSAAPSAVPTLVPSDAPSKAPFVHKTHRPSNSWAKTRKPSKAPKTANPSKQPKVYKHATPKPTNGPKPTKAPRPTKAPILIV